MFPLHEPQLDQLDEKFVLEALRSSWVSTGGPFVSRFEQEFAQYVGSKHAISVCNGTIGLYLCLEIMKRMLNIKDDFEVIVPTLTFIATANSVCHAGGVPVFVDSCRDSFNMDSENLQQILKEDYRFHNGLLINKTTSRKLLAIIPVHLMGWKSDINRIKNVLNNHCENVHIIEDAAEALGTFDLGGNHIGKEGTASVFSFNGNKILTTGSGGMIVTNDDNLAQLAKHLSTTAKTDNLRYVHDQVGFNFRLNNILASLGCAQLQKIGTYLDQKKEIFNTYSNLLRNDNVNLYKENRNGTNNWLINIIFKSNLERELALKNLVNENIHARPLWTPCHLQPAYHLSNKNSRFNYAEEWWKTTLSLPSSPNLNASEIKDIVDIVRSAL